nr:hypothetical protein [Tanacetum cinerariifolium]
MVGLLFRMFRVNRLEVKGTMHRVQVQLVMGELRTLGMQIHENEVALDEEQLLFIAADDCDAFDYDVNEAPTAQTMFMANLSSANHVYNKAGPSYDSDILSEPALYNGQEIIKTNHFPAILHNSEDTLEIAEIIRNKMKDPECVKKKLKIAPHDYSKDNYLATFTPQTQLTPEQIFWSKDLIKMKAEPLKEQTPALRPIKALTVYLPNTPATLVPMKITPTWLTKRERGFEQTKKCYLTEVIPFFKTLKDHFEGIQKALTKEIKEIKETFKELEAKVDQHVINRKHAEIKRKNLLIANDYLIANCLSQGVLYTATHSVLTFSRLSDMHEAFNAVQKRIVELESKNSNLQNKIQNDDHDVQSRGNTISELREKISRLTKKHSDVYPIHDLKALDSQNKELHPKSIPFTISMSVGGNNREVHLDYLKHLKESVATLREIIKEARVEKPFDRLLVSACRYTKHSQELVEYVIGTSPNDFNKGDKQIASTHVTRKKQVTFMNPCETSTHNNMTHLKQHTMNKTNEPVILSTGVKDATAASGSKCRSNTKKDRTLPAKNDIKK